MAKRNQKFIRQNLFDFIISNYGTLEGLQTFLVDNDLSNIFNFSSASKNTIYTVNTDENAVLTDLKRRGKVVVTGNGYDNSDYNYDFNTDFLA